MLVTDAFRFLVSSLLFSLLSTFCALNPKPVLAETVVKTGKGQSAIDRRVFYKNELLYTALDKTSEQYGKFLLEPASEKMSRPRALVALEKGDLVNTYFAPADPEWESRVIPIRIPIRKGLLNYRLLLTNKDSMAKFREITSLEELRTKAMAGLREHWTTTKVFKANGFEVMTVVDYDSLFRMLDVGRFDYIVRGVNEIFGEFDSRSKHLRYLRIEPNLVVHLPMPVYIYVSPAHPDLAKRIKLGLTTMLEDGSFDRLFRRHFQDSINKANLHLRKVIAMPNPLLSPETPFDDQKLWFHPL